MDSLINKTQLQTTIAPLVGVAAGYLAGAHVLDLSAGDWSLVITALLGAGAVLWPAIVTRIQSLKNTVGNSGAKVITTAESANALPNNPNVIAATPAIVAAVEKSAS